MVVPDFFQAYVPAPLQPLPRSRSNVIVVAVDEYLPRATGCPFTATVYVPPGQNQGPLPLELWAGPLIVVAYVPDSPPAASATDDIASAATATTASARDRLDCIDSSFG